MKIWHSCVWHILVSVSGTKNPLGKGKLVTFNGYPLKGNMSGPGQDIDTFFLVSLFVSQDPVTLPVFSVLLL